MRAFDQSIFEGGVSIPRSTQEDNLRTWTRSFICASESSPVPNVLIACKVGSCEDEDGGKENISNSRRGTAASSCGVASRKCIGGTLQR